MKEAFGAISSNPEKYDVSDELADSMDLPRDIRRADLESIVEAMPTEQAEDESNENDHGQAQHSLT